MSKTINVNDRTIRLQLWDTAGQERFHSLIPSYIRDSKTAVIVFDLTSKESFQKLPKWIEDIRNESTQMLIFIVGNKNDREDREVSKEEAEAFAEQNNAHYMETSAKTGDNVEALFRKITELLPDTAKNGNGASGRDSFQRKQIVILFFFSYKC